ncbi:Chloroperoxidase [Hysterangium stoloniferum]|nr:Chloroperoxidase [Hysterangium stoloniferum]
MVWIATAAQNIGGGVGDTLSGFGTSVLIYLWDTGLTLLNLITPKKSTEVLWPEYVPREPSDSRSPCPALNALCNHGLLPHNGRNITFKEMGDAAVKYYNFSPSFAKFVANYIRNVLGRGYNDKFDMSDIAVHNGIEHDGSLTRRDASEQPDQSYPAEELIKDLFSASKDGKILTAADLSRALTRRFIHSKKTNSQFSLSPIHRFFGASNSATMLVIFGGVVEDLKPILLEERIPKGWSSKFRSRFGLTMSTFNSTTLRVLLGVDPTWKKVVKDDL